MAYNKLHPVKLGLAAGIVTGACVFLSIVIGLLGWYQNYVALMDSWLASIYGNIGYSLSFVGAILGAVYSFIDMFIFTWIFALVYNKLIS